LQLKLKHLKKYEKLQVKTLKKLSKLLE